MNNTTSILGENQSLIKELYSKGASAPEAEEVFAKYLQELAQSTPTQDDAIMLYNTLLCHLDTVPAGYALALKGAFRRVLLAFCKEGRMALQQDLKTKLRDAIATRWSSDACTIKGISCLVPHTLYCGVIRPYFEPHQVHHALISALTNSVPATQASVDAGVLVNWGLMFENPDVLDITKPGLSEADFIQIVNDLIDICEEYYGIENTQSLINTIVGGLVVQVKSENHPLISYIRARVRNFPIAELPKILSATHMQGAFKHGLSLLFPMANKLVPAWIYAVNDLCKTKPYGLRIGFVDVTTVGAQAITPSKSFAVMTNESFQHSSAVRNAAGRFGVPYMWHAVCATASQSHSFNFTLEDIVAGRHFDTEGVYTIEPVAQKTGKIPQQSVYYNLTGDSSGANVTEKQMFAVLIQPTVPVAISPVWGTPLSKEEAETVLPYLDFVPGQEQVTLQDHILCYTQKQPLRAVANAIAALQKPCIIVKLADKWE